MNKTTKEVQEHYDASVQDWINQYDPKRLKDPTVEYPANQFRLKLLLKAFKEKDIKYIIEVGCGEGTPLIELSNLGFDVSGFDLSPKMVEAAQKNFNKHGLNPTRVWQEDIHTRQEGNWEGLIAMGVMPHVEDDELVLEKMRDLVGRGGSVFIEFRNSLFSLFTMNRYTYDFILKDLLKGVSPSLKAYVEGNLHDRMRMDMPLIRSKSANGRGRGFDTILSKFHNPFEVPELFEKLGFKDIKLHWYHYHPAMPYLREKNPKAFFEEAKKLEGTDSWRSYFLCSAFVVEAVKI